METEDGIGLATDDSVVRNPFDRVVSLYHLQKKLNCGRDSERSPFVNFVKYLIHKMTSELRFEQFVSGLDPKDSYSMCLRDCISDDNGGLLVDDVVEFENLHVELQLT